VSFRTLVQSTLSRIAVEFRGDNDTTGCRPVIFLPDILRDCLGPRGALQYHMPELTRRRNPDAPEECWHVYYGDVHAGTITIRTGCPHDKDPWEWICGF